MPTHASTEILRALADDIRLDIVKGILKDGGDMVMSCDIVDACPSLKRLAQPTISHHFAKLVDAGILIQQKDGTQNCYKLETKILESSGIDVHKL